MRPVMPNDRPAGALTLHDDIRHQVSRALLASADVITADAVAIFPYTSSASVDAPYCSRVGQALVRLLASAVRDGGVDARGALVEHLRAVALERSLAVEQLFTFAYLMERTAVDELAVNESFGATTESWPIVAQMVRRGSFEFLAAFVSRARHDPGDAAITDRLTTLYTRPVFDAVLLKEAERASRFAHPLSLILFDVDRLSAINEEFGYGVGDRILERLGILLRNYFRLHDWVARYSDDAMSVLLVGDDAAHARELAEHTRTTVEHRLGFTDHRTDESIAVTVSAAVVTVAALKAGVIDPERLLTTAEAAVASAKRKGRNRVEHVSTAAISRILPHNLPSA